MKASKFTVRNPVFTRLTTALVALVAGLALAGTGCDGGSEGDRCNPSLSHDECGTGLSCQQPFTCAENYCCPSNLASSSNPYCNGSACPAATVDAGDDGGSSGDSSPGTDAAASPDTSPGIDGSGDAADASNPG